MINGYVKEIGKHNARNSFPSPYFVLCIQCTWHNGMRLMKSVSEKDISNDLVYNITDHQC